MLVLDDQDPGHQLVPRPGAEDERRRRRASSTWTLPRWASAMAATIDRPSPNPSSPCGTPTGRSGRRCAPVGRADARPVSATASCGRAAGQRAGQRDGVARAVCFTALSHQLEQRLGDPLLVHIGGRVVGWQDAELPVAVAQGRRLAVHLGSSADRRPEPVRSRAGPTSPAGSARRPAATSGRARRAAAPRSGRPPAGRPGRRSSRWPRSTVSGVRSSWPASSRNWRWEPKPCSSRASMSLKVLFSRAMSSSPDTGRRRERSVAAISRAPARSERSGRSGRPPAAMRPPRSGPAEGARQPHRSSSPAAARPVPRRRR